MTEGGERMTRRRRHTLLPSIIQVLESLGARAWIYEDRVYHNGSQALRDEIGQRIEDLRPIGLRKTALLFGACLLVAMERECFTLSDIGDLDALGHGNALYLLEKLDRLPDRP